MNGSDNVPAEPDESDPDAAAGTLHCRGRVRPAAAAHPDRRRLDLRARRAARGAPRPSRRRRDRRGGRRHRRAGAAGPHPVDLILTDITMPRLDGFKFLSAVRNNPRLRDVMVIMLSALGESVDKVRGLTLGANDYVTKPFERAELLARVTVMLKMKELQEELQRKAAALERANLELERLANQDGLTGLPNRRSFFSRLDIEFHRSRRFGTSLSLLMLDIDHFKQLQRQLRAPGWRRGAPGRRRRAAGRHPQLRLRRALRGRGVHLLSPRDGRQPPRSSSPSGFGSGWARSRVPVAGSDGAPGDVGMTVSIGIAPGRTVPPSTSTISWQRRTGPSTRPSPRGETAACSSASPAALRRRPDGGARC